MRAKIAFIVTVIVHTGISVLVIVRILGSSDYHEKNRQGLKIEF